MQDLAVPRCGVSMRSRSSVLSLTQTSLDNLNLNQGFLAERKEKHGSRRNTCIANLPLLKSFCPTVKDLTRELLEILQE